MSMTPDEARFEQWLEELYDEHAEIAVEEFASERLSSYYLRFPQIFHAPRQALVEGSSLMPNHPRAGFILASIAVEVSLRELILRPIVHGLVVSESTASIVTDLVMSYRPMVRFKKLLFQIGNEVISEDFDELTRDGKTVTLWKEVERIRCKRNAVVHCACSVNIDEGNGVPGNCEIYSGVVVPNISGRIRIGP